MSKRHLNRRQRAYHHLHAAFPLAFPLEDAAIRPLALTTRNDLAAWIAREGLDEGTGRALLWALQHHCCRRTYQQVVAEGGMRIALQGEAVGPVTPEGQAHAQQKIAHILASRAARAQRAALRQAPVKPVTPAQAEAPAPAPAAARPVPALPTVIVKKRRKVVIPPPGER